ncbi:MAG: response regulator, partial [Deltaproteobacteria bacterium]|nr:response regulator [Deltaproteobacteria bacterium]
MQQQTTADKNNHRPTILIIDDEDRFRQALARQLEVRDFNVLETSNGEDAIKIVRHDNPEVVLLDQKMPGMDGIQTLKEIKKIRPEVQVIMHTGHGNLEAARLTGKHDVFYYLEKPSALDDLIKVVRQALEERVNALARHEIPAIKTGGLKQWLIGVHNARPGIILLGLILFAAVVLMPTPRQLQTFLVSPKTGKMGEAIAGYSDYRQMEVGQSIAEYYARKAKLYNRSVGADGKVTKTPLSADQVALRAKVMVGVLLVAALFWATGAVPIGVTALLVGVLMYFFGVFPADQVAQAYAKDSVVFIFGVLGLAAAISKTGLDRRIGILLLGTSTSLVRFALIFGPLLAVTAAFLSEHALVAFIAPIL